MIVATGENEAARVEHALDELGAREIQSLLLEGGPHLAGAFLEAGEIDEARMFVAPVLIGGAKAKTAVEGIGVGDIAAGGARARDRDRADRGRRADRGPAQGVVRCSRGSSQARAVVRGARRRRGSQVETALAERARARATRSPSTASA